MFQLLNFWEILFGNDHLQYDKVNFSEIFFIVFASKKPTYCSEIGELYFSELMFWVIISSNDSHSWLYGLACWCSQELWRIQVIGSCQLTKILKSELWDVKKKGGTNMNLGWIAWSHCTSCPQNVWTEYRNLFPLKRKFQPCIYSAWILLAIESHKSCIYSQQKMTTPICYGFFQPAWFYKEKGKEKWT